MQTLLLTSLLLTPPEEISPDKRARLNKVQEYREEKLCEETLFEQGLPVKVSTFDTCEGNTAGEVTYNYTFTDDGKLSKEEQKGTDTLDTLTYTYDDARFPNLITKLHYEPGKTSIAFTYDDQGRLVTRTERDAKNNVQDEVKLNWDTQILACTKENIRAEIVLREGLSIIGYQDTLKLDCSSLEALAADSGPSGKTLPLLSAKITSAAPDESPNVDVIWNCEETSEDLKCEVEVNRNGEKVTDSIGYKRLFHSGTNAQNFHSQWLIASGVSAQRKDDVKLWQILENAFTAKQNMARQSIDMIYKSREGVYQIKGAMRCKYEGPEEFLSERTIAVDMVGNKQFYRYAYKWND